MFLPPLHESEEHAQLRAQAKRFAQQRIAPYAHDWEQARAFPRELYRAMAETGLLGVGYPEALGGSGGDLSHALAVSEELIVHGTSPGTVAGVGSHAIALPPILTFGTDEQRQRFVPPVLAGERIAALAITEPGCGSDVAAVRTRAERHDDHYLVNGAKTFITSGCRADLVTTAVRTGGRGHGGISLLVIEASTPGVTVTKKLDKMGWWPSDTAELSFEDARVPADHLVGAENAGFGPILQNFVAERLMLVGNCVAIALLAYQESVRYARDRQAFGKSLMGFQVTRHKLADMASRIAAARATMGELLQRMLRGEASPVMAAMAKNVATDACSFVCDAAVQIHGGYGFMQETVVERLYRDARLYPIGGGTREIMNEIIAKGEGY